jgi:hypothetical protein
VLKASEEIRRVLSLEPAKRREAGEFSAAFGDMRRCLDVER